MRTLVLCAVACCYHVTFVVSFAFFFPRWHLPSLAALSNPFIPWAIWARRLWAPRKGDWLRLWLELTLAGVSDVALSPECVLYCMACLTVLIAHACPLPDGSVGGGAVGLCDSISVSMSGTSTVGQMRCVTTLAFPCSYWGQHLAFTSVLFGSRWILFRIQKLHEGWKKTFTR